MQTRHWHWQEGGSRGPWFIPVRLRQEAGCGGWGWAGTEPEVGKTTCPEGGAAGVWTNVPQVAAYRPVSRFILDANNY